MLSWVNTKDLDPEDAKLCLEIISILTKKESEGSDKKPSRFKPEELVKGIEFELKYSTNTEDAVTMAIEHLNGDDSYYSDLDKIKEEEAKKNKAIGPFKSNYDYGGNYLDRIKRKRKRSSKFKKTIK